MFVIVGAVEQEEQHANTSANYDVELLHHKDAHLEFFKSGECSSSMDTSVFLTVSIENVVKFTIKVIKT